MTNDERFIFNNGEILLDKYRIEALLGQGAFAEVYRVTHLDYTHAKRVFSYQ
jgi:serine/threonine protein kinase